MRKTFIGVADYKYGMSLLMPNVSRSSKIADFRRFLFLLEVFEVRIWLVKALLLLTFPLPVNEKRLAAPLCVLSFGISNLQIIF